MALIGISGKKQHGKNTVASIIQYLITKDKIEKDINSKLQYPSLINFIKEGAGGKKEYSGWEQKAFATKLKEIVCLLIGCTMWELEDGDFKETPLNEDWWYYRLGGNILHSNVDYKEIQNTKDKIWLEQADRFLVKPTPRLLLQQMGTECGREILHPQLWVNALFADYKPLMSLSTEIMDLGASNIQREKIGKSIPLELPNWLITDVRFPNEVRAIEDKGGIVIRVTNYNRIYTSADTHPSETSLDTHIFKYSIKNDGNIDELVENVEILLKQLKII